MEAREFHIGDVLSVTTEVLVSPRLMRGVCDILNFMAGERLFTHQLVRVADEAKPVLIELHPFLADITAETVNAGNCEAWLQQIIAEHGETLPVRPMTEDEHERVDAASELIERVHPDRIINLGKGGG